MCEINQKNQDNCKCNAKEICCKMQKDSLRTAIVSLKKNQNCSNTILSVLNSIINLITVYKCLPGSCLLKRIKFVYNNITPSILALNTSEVSLVNILIAELEAFLND